MVFTLFNIWFERRVVARMQHRIGPNRVGPSGTLQSLADGIKLMLKEDLMPKAVDRVVYVLAPIMAAVPAFLAVAVIPFGPVVGAFTSTHTPLQLTDLPVAVLTSWRSPRSGCTASCSPAGRRVDVLAARRAALVGAGHLYEVAMGLSFVAVFLYAGSLSTSHRRRAGPHLVRPRGARSVVRHLHGRRWSARPTRAPFDLPEAEGELVGGFHTEYRSIKFALFFLAEYINMVTVSMLATTLFLGGWRAPWPLSHLVRRQPGYWPVLWFFGKLLLFVFVSSGCAGRCRGCATTSS